MGGLSGGRIKIWGGVGFPGCYPFTTEWQVMAMICLGYGFAAPIAVHFWTLWLLPKAQLGLVEAQWVGGEGSLSSDHTRNSDPTHP